MPRPRRFRLALGMRYSFSLAAISLLIRWEVVELNFAGRPPGSYRAPEEINRDTELR